CFPYTTLFRSCRASSWSYQERAWDDPPRGSVVRTDLLPAALTPREDRSDRLSARGRSRPPGNPDRTGSGSLGVAQETLVEPLPSGTSSTQVLPGASISGSPDSVKSCSGTSTAALRHVPVTVLPPVATSATPSPTR